MCCTLTGAGAVQAVEGGLVDAQPVVVDGDRVLLDRLVQNLLLNAIRHNVPAAG
jgi:signal transduction histidine kinase